MTYIGFLCLVLLHAARANPFGPLLKQAANHRQAASKARVLEDDQVCVSLIERSYGSDLCSCAPDGDVYELTCEDLCKQCETTSTGDEFCIEYSDLLSRHTMSSFGIVPTYIRYSYISGPTNGPKQLFEFEEISSTLTCEAYIDGTHCSACEYTIQCGDGFTPLAVIDCTNIDGVDAVYDDCDTDAVALLTPDDPFYAYATLDEDFCVENHPIVDGETPAETTAPTPAPTVSPTGTRTAIPTASPSRDHTASPTASPTSNRTASPTASPTSNRTASPTASPTSIRTASPTASPTSNRTASPTSSPTLIPKVNATVLPDPEVNETMDPSSSPTSPPSAPMSMIDSSSPSSYPSLLPVKESKSPTAAPTTNMTKETVALGPFSVYLSADGFTYEDLNLEFLSTEMGALLENDLALEFENVDDVIVTVVDPPPRRNRYSRRELQFALFPVFFTGDVIFNGVAPPAEYVVAIQAESLEDKERIQRIFNSTSDIGGSFVVENASLGKPSTNPPSAAPSELPAPTETQTEPTMTPTVQPTETDVSSMAARWNSLLPVFSGCMMWLASIIL